MLEVGQPLVAKVEIVDLVDKNSLMHNHNSMVTQAI